MTVAANTRHGTRVRQPQIFTLLKLTKKKPSLNSGSNTKRWRFHFAVQPHKRFTDCIHALFISYLIYSSHSYNNVANHEDRKLLIFRDSVRQNRCILSMKKVKNPILYPNMLLISY
jgi:hypothetical protein